MNHTLDNFEAEIGYLWPFRICTLGAALVYDKIIPTIGMLDSATIYTGTGENQRMALCFT